MNDREWQVAVGVVYVLFAAYGAAWLWVAYEVWR